MQRFLIKAGSTYISHFALVLIILIVLICLLSTLEIKMVFLQTFIILYAIHLDVGFGYISLLK